MVSHFNRYSYTLWGVLGSCGRSKLIPLWAEHFILSCRTDSKYFLIYFVGWGPGCINCFQWSFNDLKMTTILYFFFLFWAKVHITKIMSTVQNLLHWQGPVNDWLMLENIRAGCYWKFGKCNVNMFFNLKHHYICSAIIWTHVKYFLLIM